MHRWLGYSSSIDNLWTDDMCSQAAIAFVIGCMDDYCSIHPQHIFFVKRLSQRSIVTSEWLLAKIKRSSLYTYITSQANFSCRPFFTFLFQIKRHVRPWMGPLIGTVQKLVSIVKGVENNSSVWRIRSTKFEDGDHYNFFPVPIKSWSKRGEDQEDIPDLRHVNRAFLKAPYLKRPNSTCQTIWRFYRLFGYVFSRGSIKQIHSSPKHRRPSLRVVMIEPTRRSSVLSSTIGNGFHIFIPILPFSPSFHLKPFLLDTRDRRYWLTDVVDVTGIDFRTWLKLRINCRCRSVSAKNTHKPAGSYPVVCAIKAERIDSTSISAVQ